MNRTTSPLCAPNASPRSDGRTLVSAPGLFEAAFPLAAYFGGLLLARGAAGLAGAADSPGLRVGSALFGGAGAALVLLLGARSRGLDFLGSVGLRGRFGGALARGLALYGMALPVLWFASLAGARLFGSEGSWPWPSDLLTLAGAGTLLALVSLIPFLEEILFRGWLLERACARLGPLLGVSSVAVLWALGHEPGSRPAIFVLGLLLGFLYRRTGRLGACVGVHALHNALALVLRYPGLRQWTGA